MITKCILCNRTDIVGSKLRLCGLHYQRYYKLKNEEKMKSFAVNRWIKDKNDEKVKEYMRNYRRNWQKQKLIKDPQERKKMNLRCETYRIYGKVPSGYERHHLNYDSPHNFILVPIKKHRELHKRNLNTMKGGIK